MVNDSYSMFMVDGIKMTNDTVFTLLFPQRDYYFNLIKKAGLLERRVYWRGGIIFSMP